MTETYGPWLAWARTGPGHKAVAVSIDHATSDGVTTLCGLKEIGGSDRSVPFAAESHLSCKRCSAACTRNANEYIKLSEEQANKLGLGTPFGWGLNQPETER